MKRNSLALCILFLFAFAVYGEKREIHILATNDMHATLERMPQLADMADSLRTVNSRLLIFSAGDNRTGNPLNDVFEIPAYPMVALMNLIGFNASAIGNHEFDSGTLPRLFDLSSFRYLCANIFADDSAGIKTLPYQIFYIEGMKVGVVGVIQVGENGQPSTHPDNLRGIKFKRAAEILGQYEWLSHECDVTILLSHLGYDDDVEMARQFPWFDLIIGGHSHKQLKASEPLHDGVLITQCANLLNRAAHITLTVDSGHVVDKRAEYLNVRTHQKKNPIAEMLVEHIKDNPQFSKVIAHAETAFETKEELGCMVCDAYLDAFNVDIALVNPGGVRADTLAAGNITLLDALRIDPFVNKSVIIELTGHQIADMMLSYCHHRFSSFPFCSGMRCEVTLMKDNPRKIQSVRLLTPKGKKMDMNRRYRIVTNNYISATTSVPQECIHVQDALTNELLIRYLEKQQTLNYKGARCHKIIEQ